MPNPSDHDCWKRDLSDLVALLSRTHPFDHSKCLLKVQHGKLFTGNHEITGINQWIVVALNLICIKAYQKSIVVSYIHSCTESMGGTHVDTSSYSVIRCHDDWSLISSCYRLRGTQKSEVLTVATSSASAPLGTLFRRSRNLVHRYMGPPQAEAWEAEKYI